VADGSEHLRCADVGTGEHADFAVGMRQSGGPFDCVVAVVGLVLEGVPLALGLIAAADILRDDHEAVFDGFWAEGGEVVFVIRGAHEQDVEGAFASGAIDVGEEGDAVAGLHGNVFLSDDAGGDYGGGGLGCADQGCGANGGEADELFEHGNSGRLETGNSIKVGVQAIGIRQ